MPTSIGTRIRSLLKNSKRKNVMLEVPKRISSIACWAMSHLCHQKDGPIAKTEKCCSKHFEKLSSLVCDSKQQKKRTLFSHTIDGRGTVSRATSKMPSLAY